MVFDMVVYFVFQVIIRNEFMLEEIRNIIIVLVFFMLRMLVLLNYIRVGKNCQGIIKISFILEKFIII